MFHRFTIPKIATAVPRHLVFTLEDLAASEPTYLSRREYAHVSNLKIALENEIARGADSRRDHFSS